MKKLYCDVCGQVIHTEKSTSSFPIRSFYAEGRDMCEPCHTKFVNDLNSWLEEYFKPVKYRG